MWCNTFLDVLIEWHHIYKFAQIFICNLMDTLMWLFSRVTCFFQVEFFPSKHLKYHLLPHSVIDRGCFSYTQKKHQDITLNHKKWIRTAIKTPQSHQWPTKTTKFTSVNFTNHNCSPFTKAFTIHNCSPVLSHDCQLQPGHEGREEPEDGVCDQPSHNSQLTGEYGIQGAALEIPSKMVLI